MHFFIYIPQKLWYNNTVTNNNMLNKLQTLLVHLNAQPTAADGFTARELYTTGMEYGLTCKEVKDTFLGKQKALARGKYPAAVSDDVLEASKNAPTAKVKTAKVKAVKKTRNTSTAVVAKTDAMDKAAKEKRRDLIAKIAKRHADDDKMVAELEGQNNHTEVETDDGTKEEFDKLLVASTSKPA
jgi:hypothetical protein